MSDNIILPNRIDTIYNEIENFEDYEYTSCIAYEMAIRNDEVKRKINILNKVKALKNNIVKKRKSRDNTGSKWRFKNYPIISNKYFEEIIITFLKRFYSVNYNYKEYKKHDNPILITRTSLHNDIFAEGINCLLEKNFIQSNYKVEIRKGYLIEQKYNKRTGIYNSVIKPNFSRKIELNNLYSIDTLVSLNLYLPKDELIAYVSKIKDEYDKDNSLIHSPLELLGEEIAKAEKIKSKALPKEKRKRKKSLADAFYIYDVWKILEPYYVEKTIQLKTEQEKEIKAIKQNFYYDKYDKKSKIDEIKDSYKAKIKNECSNEMALVPKIAKLLNTSEDTVNRLHSFMIKYIDNLKYKELFTGISN